MKVLKAGRGAHLKGDPCSVKASRAERGRGGKVSSSSVRGEGQFLFLADTGGGQYISSVVCFWLRCVVLSIFVGGGGWWWSHWKFSSQKDLVFLNVLFWQEFLSGCERENLQETL